MSESFYHNVKVSLHIVKDNNFHFYTRRENGRIVIDAERISAQRAADIMQLNEEDPAVTISQRQADCGFSWMADVVVQVEDTADA